MIRGNKSNPYAADEQRIQKKTLRDKSQDLIFNVEVPTNPESAKTSTI